MRMSKIKEKENESSSEENFQIALDFKVNYVDNAKYDISTY